ncbi:uncharacterized protein LOC115375422 [Myripristis murdjan]|uniref:uncharacterized protein LOC115375422 n=1 Tax=Myripristis murdjan TaxID=586833 RepID=UPI001175F140|nr:uncharacterized protein LOC115375422 [Myripristis murdjan]
MVSELFKHVSNILLLVTHQQVKQLGRPARLSAVKKRNFLENLPTVQLCVENQDLKTENLHTHLTSFCKQLHTGWSLQGRVSSDGAGGLLQVSSGRALNASWQLCRKSPTDTVHLRPDGIALRLLRLLACRLLFHFYVTVEVRAGVAMAAQLHQEQVSLTSRTKERVSITCKGTEQCSYDFVYWYQKNETETFKLILLIDVSDGAVHKGYNHPEEDDFSVKGRRSSSQVFVTALFTVGGSDYWYKIFGSGTRLYVTDRPVVPPKVSVYPATRADLKGKSSLLCLATSMFPPLVQFSWRTQENNGPPPEGERVALREEEHAASILLIDQEDLITYQYICSVKHQIGTVEAKIPGNEETNCGVD